jgi:hypothetical protein
MLGQYLSAGHDHFFLYHSQYLLKQWLIRLCKSLATETTLLIGRLISGAASLNKTLTLMTWSLAEVINHQEWMKDYKYLWNCIDTDRSS